MSSSFLSGPQWTVLDLLHAHRVLYSVLCTCQQNLFAIRTNFVSSVRKSARTWQGSALRVLVCYIQNKKDNNKCHCPFYGGR